MAPRVICTCYHCIKSSVTINGTVQPGRLVHATTRRNHEKHIQHSASPRLRQTPSSSASKQYKPPDTPTDITFSTVQIVQMVCILIAWLHLQAGVSRSVANTILKAVQLIISMALHLIETALSSAGFTISLVGLTIPQDVRTAFVHCIHEPDIIRIVCCPVCFSLYSRPVPLKCQWKESPRSRPCNTDLWKHENTSKGPKEVPKRFYSTQSFDSWLEFFLARKVIVNALDETFRQRGNRPAAFGGDMHDVQDSPAWQDLTGIFSNPYHLVFGIYVD
ncbi:hypothetical protein BDZ94DRAFT_1327589 [Collybia nuda]|uniref:Transposase n=1 Tax=Collybia nuda TaxID=64659 RepID=A0A9P5XTX3_9AGAR|nr:hypothetical protein BDZ94DRAFT_1327589 [Collybia nuda]